MLSGKRILLKSTDPSKGISQPDWIFCAAFFAKKNSIIIEGVSTHTVSSLPDLFVVVDSRTMEENETPVILLSRSSGNGKRSKWPNIAIFWSSRSDKKLIKVWCIPSVVAASPCLHATANEFFAAPCKKSQQLYSCRKKCVWERIQRQFSIERCKQH